MRLSAKPLINVDGLNAFEYGQDWFVRQNGLIGEATTLYFQIVDLDRSGLSQECCGSSSSPQPTPPIRYMPMAGSTLEVTFPSLDDTLVLEIAATQPFAADPSIWAVALSSAQLPAAGNVQFVLTQPTMPNPTTNMWHVRNLMRVDMLNSGAV